MTTTSKYGFKVSIDQCGNFVLPDFADSSEQSIIDVFEQETLRLKEKNKPRYSMIEFGAKWAYYSLLFHNILGKDKVTSIMVEPYLPHLERGKRNFKLNDCQGIWYNRGIGTIRHCANTITSVEPILIDEILKDQSLTEVDCIHCDADGPEVDMLEENMHWFAEGKVGVVFLLTHDCHGEPKQIHNRCKKFFVPFDYSLIYEESEIQCGPYHTSDRVLVYRKN